LELDGVLPYVWIRREAGYFAGLPAPTLARRRTLLFHPSSLQPALEPGFHPLIKELGLNFPALGLLPMQDRSVILVVHSEEEKKEAEEAVRTSDWLPECRNAFAAEVRV